MRNSPTFMGLLYAFIGTLFIYLAINNVNANGWDIWTILLIVFATMDYVVAIRFFKKGKPTK